MNRTPNEVEQNGRYARKICDDFCARFGESAANFDYKIRKIQPLIL